MTSPKQYFLPSATLFTHSPQRPPSVGTQSVKWLYCEQLKVDDEHALAINNGFKWWPKSYAQTIEVVGEEKGPAGDKGYLLSVRTDLLRDMDLTDKALGLINSRLLSTAAMAGAVYDQKKRTLYLATLTRVHREISMWMDPLLSVAAVMQIAEAEKVAPRLAYQLTVCDAKSNHPSSGCRQQPHEMTDIVPKLIMPLGVEQSKWEDAEFREVVDRYMQAPPALLATVGRAGCTVEFPYGKNGSSLCQLSGSEPHPVYGNGLSVVQKFPLRGMGDIEGIKLALAFINLSVNHDNR